MATFTDKFVAGNSPTQESRISSYTDSYAKKFVTPDSVSNNDPTESTSNAEHLITAAAGVKSVSYALRQIAEQSRQQISQAVSSLLQTGGVLDPLTRSLIVQYTESDVNVLQNSMAQAASTGYGSIGDPNLFNTMNRRTQSLISNSRHAVIPLRMENMTVRTTNNFKPEIESVIVDIDANNSVIDNFYVELVINLPTSSVGKLKALRVFRTKIDNPIFTRPLAPLSSNGLQIIQSFRGKKNQDQASMMVNRLAINNVKNAASSLNYMNPLTNQRVSAQDSTFSDPTNLVPPPLAGRTTISSQIPEAFQHLDKSILENINVVYNLKNNPVFSVSQPTSSDKISVGGSTFRGGSNVVIDQSNKLKFQEVAIFSPGSIASRVVGKFVEYRFVDESVSYGCGYKYFVVSVDDQIVQSPRSQVVDAVIEGIRIPMKPNSVVASKNQSSISLTIKCPDKLVEKFEIYRFDENPNASTRSIYQSISDQQGYSTSFVSTRALDTGFMLIGESINSTKQGSSFFDASAQPGRPYVYRVYSVDVFGNKSESPLEINVHIPDEEQQIIPLKAPSILAEVDISTHKMKISFSCDDLHVQRMTLERRDLTIGEEVFSIPTTPSRIILGYGRNPAKNRNSMVGEILFNNNLDDSWNGTFERTAETQVFIDKTVQFDHIYQYRIFGEDRYGNRTNYALSSYVMVVRRTIINPPSALKTTVIFNSGSDAILGVGVSWIAGSQDVHALEMMGSQSKLTDSSVRTLYQIQRRHQGEDRWLNFPLISGTAFLDPVSADTSPKFRPPYPDINEIYYYRVQAVQTGTFISNFSAQSNVFVGFLVAAPTNFSIRSPSTTVSPFYTMLNWDTPLNSGVVDHWDIERAEVNNFAAASINLSDTNSFKNLNYTSFKTVYRESSRFSSTTVDSSVDPTRLSGEPVVLTSDILIGQHYYLDSEVQFGNTYFYRIRAISPEGNISTWTFKGIKLTSTVFEQKYIPTVTNEEKQELVKAPVPQVIISQVVPPQGIRRRPTPIQDALNTRVRNRIGSSFIPWYDVRRSQVENPDE